MANKESFITLLCKEYGGRLCAQHGLIEHHGYFFTVYQETERTVLSLELPGASVEQLQAVKDLIDPADTCEYYSPTFRIFLSRLQEEPRGDQLPVLVDYINRSAAALEEAGFTPNVCTYCQKGEADVPLAINGFYCACHQDCYSKLLPLSKPAYRASARNSVLGLFFAVLWGTVGAAAMIPLALAGIMPGLAGIAIGLLAALGFRVFNRGVSTWHKVFLVVFFLLVSAGANFIADALYAQQQGLQLDFAYTYADSVNLFNTVFDVLSATLLAYFSANIVFDFNRGQSGFSLRRLSKDGKA